jgi:hypothetical protein
MVGSLVFILVIVTVAGGWRIRSIVRRRADATPVITTWPEIELSEAYGGWHANPYDAGTGRDHTPAMPIPPACGPWFTLPRSAR